MGWVRYNLQKNVTKYAAMRRPLGGPVLASLLLVGDHAFLDHLGYLHGEPGAEPEGHGVRDAEFGSVSERVISIQS